MNQSERQCFRDLIASAPAGPRIEFGVFRGATLRMMAGHAGETIGVDSFEGMPDHGERDEKDGWVPYPAGRLASPPPVFPKSLGVQLIRGFVPDVLDSLPSGPYAFAHVDMDQYASTSAAIEWLFPRMLTGGIICCDDWFADRDWLAAGAINEFATHRPLSGTRGRKAWWIL